MSGNLTRNPELRFTPAGLAVASLRVANNDRVQNDAGEWVDREETEFFNVTCWRYLAENACESLQKGDRIVAHGYWQKESYTNQYDEDVTEDKFTARDLGPSLMFKTAGVHRKTSRSRDDDEPPF